MEKHIEYSFADLAVAHRKVKSEFFEQINCLVDWSSIERLIKRYYNKGKSAVGRESYSGLLLFKITLLQTWYGLSDYEVEDQVSDRISFSRFVGLSLDSRVPDHSVISRFRTALTKNNAYESLLNEINKQLEEHHILVRTGVIVDASITDTQRKPRGRKTYEAVEDRNEETGEVEQKLEEQVQKHVDREGKWIKKGDKLRYGYKQHTGVDENGLVLGIVTTSANESDMKHLEDVLDKIELEERATVESDKGYDWKNNHEAVSKKGLKNRIMRKATKGKGLTKWEKRFNQAISRTRYKVERTFGSIKRWFNTGVARYVGLAKMHTQHLMEAIAYNLYRSPGIIMSFCKK